MDVEDKIWDLISMRVPSDEEILRAHNAHTTAGPYKAERGFKAP